MQSHRKFWREMLPRIKYRNPALPIQISRHSDPSGPSLLHIYMSANPGSQPAATSSPATTETSTPPSGTPNPRNTLTPDTSTPTHSIDIKMKGESEILDQLIEKTGAVVIQPTPQELGELEEIKEFKERAEKDRVDVREKLMKERREEELLRLARGEAAAAT